MPSCFKTRLQTAFDLVRTHVNKAHQRQKEFYNRKIHGNPYRAGDLVWLHSPVPKRASCRKLHHPWTGPFKVLKQLSDTTYRIQHLHCNRRRKVVHFERLKPCTNTPTHTDNQRQTKQDHNQSTENTPSSANLPPAVGTNLELIEDDEDTGSGSTSSRAPPPSDLPTAAVRRYPVRVRNPPTRYNDFINH